MFRPRALSPSPTPPLRMAGAVQFRKMVGDAMEVINAEPREKYFHLFRQLHHVSITPHEYLPPHRRDIGQHLRVAWRQRRNVLSGMFGVGGGFLMTPLLKYFSVFPQAWPWPLRPTRLSPLPSRDFSRICAAAMLILKSAHSCLSAAWSNSTLGVGLFRWLKDLGHIDLIISLCYVSFLGIVGAYHGQRQHL